VRPYRAASSRTGKESRRNNLLILQGYSLSLPARGEGFENVFYGSDTGRNRHPGEKRPELGRQGEGRFLEKKEDVAAGSNPVAGNETNDN